MTEHAAVIFVFFFLAEYASILLMCVLTGILFLGGYLLDYSLFIYLIQYLDFDYYITIINGEIKTTLSDYIIEGAAYGIILGVKTSIMIFVFIWVRASFPRVRFDQLMSFCWTVLLPVVIALIILVPCVLYSCSIMPSNVFLL